MQYKATIIIPVYNKENFLKRSLNSIVRLSRFEEFEVLLIDDHSSDNSVSIIKEYTEKYSNIRLIEFEQGSGSPSKPRNTGIEESTADYLIFMDPDDQIINDGYSVLLSKMEEYRSDILIGTRIGVTESGTRTFTDFIDVNYTYINSNDYDIKFDLLNRRPFILKTIYKKSLITDNNIYFNEKITTSEDECFDSKCMAYAKKITKINDIVYQYTAEASGSITTNVAVRLYEELYDVMESLYEAYILTFDEKTTISKIADTIKNYYFNRISLMNATADVNRSLDSYYEAVKRFGFERFSIVDNDQTREFFEDVKHKRFQSWMATTYINRIRVLNKRIEELGREKDKKNKEIKKLKRIQNRKTVKMGIALANAISRVKK